MRNFNHWIDQKNPPKEIPKKIIAECFGCGAKAYACPNGCGCAPCKHGFFGAITHTIGCGPIKYYPKIERSKV